jgi:putative transposase
MLKSYKYRIYPTKTQQDHLVQSMGCVRYIYNKALETKIQYYEATKKNLSYFDLIRTLLVGEKRANEWLKIVNAQSLQMGIHNVDGAFKKFYTGQNRFPNFKKRSNIVSLQYLQGIWVDFKKSIVKVPKAGKVHCIFDRQFKGDIKTCTVSKTPTNKFFISILVDDCKELPLKTEIKSETSMGIDLGLKHFLITSTGDKIENPKYLRKQLARLKVLQQRASKKQKGSKNRHKENLKVAKLYEKITNQRKDFLHKTSSKIISENQTIITEDLNIAGMVKNHKLAQSISDVSWSEFIRQLKYKAEWYGKNLIQIGRFEPSSKTCSCCGWKNNDLSTKDREWSCQNCYTHHDRDINAAINIKKFGLIKANAGQELAKELVEMPISDLVGENKIKLDRRSKKISTIKSRD